MNEKADSYNDSFNEDFCLHLEKHLSGTFAQCNNQEFRYFWCDGVLWAPYFSPKDNIEYLSYENVKKRGKIETTAWMGADGQEQYKMTIKLGKNSINKYKTGESLKECLPSQDTMDWIDIDTKNRTIEIRLK